MECALVLSYQTLHTPTQPCTERVKPSQIWPQLSIVSSVSPKIYIPNLSNESCTLKRTKHFCQVRPVFETLGAPHSTPTTHLLVLQPTKATHSSTVQIRSDNLLPQEERPTFQALLKEYDTVFDPNIKGYKGSS